MSLYPLTFSPILKPKIWGGSRLNQFKNIHPPVEKLGESWEVSAVEGDISVVSEGLLKGQSLTELIDQHGTSLLGSEVVKKYGNQFPLLIKFIHAEQDLSIQVHPDDDMASRYHDSFGKTEMWYVIDTDGDASLTLGVQGGVDKTAFAKAIKNNTVEDLLLKEKVSAGDSFFIRPGLIHAIGAGTLLAEIQQTSDITYRVYDYDRKDSEGNKRELHIEKSLEAADFRSDDSPEIEYDRSAQGQQKLAHCPYFKTDIIQWQGSHAIDHASGERFHILINLGQEFVMTADGLSYPVVPGKTYLLPASLEDVNLSTETLGKVLLTTV